MPTLYFHIFAASYLDLKMSVNVKFDDADFIGIFNFEWPSKNKVLCCGEIKLLLSMSAANLPFNLALRKFLTVAIPIFKASWSDL